MVNPSINQLLPSISKILVILQSGDVDLFPKRKKIDNIVQESGIEKEIVLSTLSILAILGFVDIRDNEDVIISSKYPNLAISALRERLDLSFSVIHNLRDDEKKRYFREFTKSLEIIRKDTQGAEIPIHNRAMVNIIIKGRQIKDWKHEEVFLHTFHSEWNEYHLIGIGMRGENSIDELAHKAMSKRLHLEPFNYEFDPNINPPSIEYTSISKSQGGLTFYTIHTRVISKLNLDLNEHLEKEIHKGGDFTKKTFKWFSLKEINQGNIIDASIMESTTRVLGNLKLAQIPVVVPQAKRFETGPLLDVVFFSDLPNRLHLSKMLFYIFVAISTLLVGFNFTKFINVPLYWLDNINSIVSVTSIIISFFVFARGIDKAT